MRKSAAVIFNPTSGTYKRKTINDIATALYENDYNPKIIASEYSGHVKEIIKNENEERDLITTVGGDGTFSEAVTTFCNLEQHATYTHFAAGTTNDIKRNFGLASRPRQFSKMIMESTPQNLDVFGVNGVPFGYISAFGHLVSSTYLADPKYKRIIGNLAYFIEIFKQLFPIETQKVVYRANDEEKEIETILWAITNSKFFAHLQIYGDDYVKFDDGLFEVLFIKAGINPRQIIKLLKAFFTKNIDLSNFEDCLEFFQAEAMQVQLENPLKHPINHDGDRGPSFTTLNYERMGNVKMLIRK